MNKIKEQLKKFGRDHFNDFVLKATYKAQKKYGFEIGTGEHATWNNEADAFKHAYMSWLLSWYAGDKKSKELGDMHEDETPNAPIYERNMDLWNNSIGREIAYEMDKKYGKARKILNIDWASDIASEMIWEKMQKGELITNPFKDKRKFENMELERLTEDDRVYSEEEYKKLDKKAKEGHYKQYASYIINNKWERATVNNLNKKVQSGELIYVDNYTRSDGTRVNGYYRRRPYYRKGK